jgi:hypothetical protein
MEFNIKIYPRETELQIGSELNQIMEFSAGNL